jgi:hypothetical protein
VGFGITRKEIGEHEGKGEQKNGTTRHVGREDSRQRRRCSSSRLQAEQRAEVDEIAELAEEDSILGLSFFRLFINSAKNFSGPYRK